MVFQQNKIEINYEIAGDNKVHLQAEAMMSGNKIVVSNPTITNPVYVRYAWSDSSNTLVFVTDGNGNPVRHPIKMSAFEERPRFYQAKGKVEKIERVNGYSMEKSDSYIKNSRGSSIMLIDLFQLIPSTSKRYNSLNKNKLTNIRRSRKKRF
ncbi:MAG TPA: hypothetical protein VFC65_10095 [Prolixibacteraceae bacterium]|nr:hypothetical protein [Prolixibacteraceae bacterium]